MSEPLFYVRARTIDGTIFVDKVDGSYSTTRAGVRKVTRKEGERIVEWLQAQRGSVRNIGEVVGQVRLEPTTPHNRTHVVRYCSGPFRRKEKRYFRKMKIDDAVEQAYYLGQASQFYRNRPNPFPPGRRHAAFEEGRHTDGERRMFRR